MEEVKGRQVHSQLGSVLHEEREWNGNRSQASVLIGAWSGYGV